jgi:Cu/Zn superoxide dismutase
MHIFQNPVAGNNLVKSLLLFLLMAVMASCSKENIAPTDSADNLADANARKGANKDMKVYVLKSVAVPSISGTVTFEKKNKSTLISIELTGTPNGGVHPAHIHLNSAVEGGAIAISLDPVNGSSGKSKTLVTQLDNGTSISYEELLNFDGYVNVHLSPSDLATIVAQGDIGGNELTGRSKMYSLAPVAVPAISGNALFEERKNGNTLVTLSLVNTPAGGMHPAHIHANSAAVGGPIVVTFNDVNGTTGKSMTNVRALNNGTPITYSGLLVYNGYINVHLSMEQLAVIVAQGNIGSNSPH